VVGLAAPRDTPVEMIEKLNHEVNAAFADPRMKTASPRRQNGLAGSPADLGCRRTENPSNLSVLRSGIMTIHTSDIASVFFLSR